MKKSIIGVGLFMVIASTACYAATQPHQNPGLSVKLTVSSFTRTGACFQEFNTSEPPHCTYGNFPGFNVYPNLPGPLTLQLSAVANTMNVGDDRYQEDASCQKYFPLDQLRKYQTKGKTGEVDISVTATMIASSPPSYKLTSCQVVDASHN